MLTTRTGGSLSGSLSLMMYMLTTRTAGGSLSLSTTKLPAVKLTTRNLSTISKREIINIRDSLEIIEHILTDHDPFMPKREIINIRDRSLKI
jgi:hypothetical protein